MFSVKYGIQVYVDVGVLKSIAYYCKKWGNVIIAKFSSFTVLISDFKKYLLIKLEKGLVSSLQRNTVCHYEIN